MKNHLTTSQYERSGAALRLTKRLVAEVSLADLILDISAKTAYILALGLTRDRVGPEPEPFSPSKLNAWSGDGSNDYNSLSGQPRA